VIRGVARKILLITILLAVTGGQWAVLQSAAWAGMLVNHLRTESLASAVSKTFDGDHPCPMCKAIERGKKSEKKSDLAGSIPRFEFPPAQEHSGLTTDESLCAANAAVDEFSESLGSAPLLRPPRAIPA